MKARPLLLYCELELSETSFNSKPVLEMSLKASSIKNVSSDDEKVQVEKGVVEPYTDIDDTVEQNEVFKKSHDGVDFRTVGWPRASVIFLKGTEL